MCFEEDDAFGPVYHGQVNQKDQMGIMRMWAAWRSKHRRDSGGPARTLTSPLFEALSCKE